MILDWTQVVKRLTMHRHRLKMSKQEMIEFIKAHYDKPFSQFSDTEVIEFGKMLKQASTKQDLYNIKKRQGN